MTTTTITIEEFKQFHAIDRDMYRKLTFYLHHDPLLSIRVMSFWLWLESSGMHRDFVSYLHSLPSHLLNSLVLETITCLCCLDYSSSTLPLEIPCLQHIVNNRSFSLPYLVNNRTTILESMQKISNTVCARALDDLLSQLLSQQSQTQTQTQTPGGSMFQPGSNSMDHVDAMTPIGVGPRRSNVNRGDMAREMMMIRSEEQEIVDTMINTDQSISPQQPHLTKTNRGHEKTVFLTFSKGYPVTESQLIDFFTRRFGEIIEELIMQEVPLGEQPLYARMLVHSSNEVETVLGGQNRVKFTINGKHVYARKYVKKNPNASSSSSSSSHQHYYSPPPSPM